MAPYHPWAKVLAALGIIPPEKTLLRQSCASPIAAGVIKQEKTMPKKKPTKMEEEKMEEEEWEEDEEWEEEEEPEEEEW
jgi:flagellar biosynthesis component FlhA